MVARKEGGVKIVHFQLEEEEYAKLKAYAASRGMSFSEWIRNAIRKQLARECDPRIFPEK